MTEVTFEEYRGLMAQMMSAHVSPYIESEIEEFEKLVNKIEAIENAHPEYEEML